MLGPTTKNGFLPIPFGATPNAASSARNAALRMWMRVFIYPMQGEKSVACRSAFRGRG